MDAAFNGMYQNEMGMQQQQNVGLDDRRINTVVYGRYISQEFLKRIKNMNRSHTMSLNDALTVCNVLGLYDDGSNDQVVLDVLVNGYKNVVNYIQANRANNVDLTKELQFIAAMCGWEMFVEVNNCLIAGVGVIAPAVGYFDNTGRKFSILTETPKNLNYACV